MSASRIRRAAPARPVGGRSSDPVGTTFDDLVENPHGRWRRASDDRLLAVRDRAADLDRWDLVDLVDDELSLRADDRCAAAWQIDR